MSFFYIDDFRYYFKDIYILYVNDNHDRSSRRGTLYVETVDRWEAKGILKNEKSNIYCLPSDYSIPHPKKTVKKHKSKPRYFFDGLGYLEGLVSYHEKKILD